MSVKSASREPSPTESALSADMIETEKPLLSVKVSFLKMRLNGMIEGTTCLMLNGEEAGKKRAFLNQVGYEFEVPIDELSLVRPKRRNKARSKRATGNRRTRKPAVSSADGEPSDRF